MNTPKCDELDYIHFLKICISLKGGVLVVYAPDLVAFDSWYASLDNLKPVRSSNWHWLTQLKNNRLVNNELGH